MSHVIAAVSTGLSVSAIGILRLSGDGCAEIAGKVFTLNNGIPLQDAPNRKLVLGTLRDKDGRIIDSCLAVYTRCPHSYTGEDVVELSCHGGTAVAKLLVEACIRAGAAPAGPGEYTRRALLNGKLSLTQAEAVMDLVSATGRQGAALANAALGGALAKTIGGHQAALTAVRAHLAAWVDYPDDDIPAVEE